MMKRAVLLLAAVLLADPVWAAGLQDLRAAVAREDREAVRRWLAENTERASEDPLSSLGSRAPSPALKQKADALRRDEMAVESLGFLYVGSPAPNLQKMLLNRIDALLSTRRAVEQEAQREEQRPLPASLRLKDFQFARAPGERNLRLSFAYEGAKAGAVVLVKWLLLGDKAQAVGEGRVQLRAASGRAELSQQAPGVSRWMEGSYRAELFAHGEAIAQVYFSLPAAGGRAPGGPLEMAKAAPPAPETHRAAPERSKTAPPARREPPRAPAPALSPAVTVVPPPVPVPAAPRAVQVLQAAFTKDVVGGEPKDVVEEYTTVRRRLILWAKVDGGPGGGALTARWRAGKGPKQTLGEHTLRVGPGESRVAFWLEPAVQDMQFPRGEIEVELLSGGKLLQAMPLRIRKAGMLETLGGALEEAGQELNKALQEGTKQLREEFGR